MKNIVAVNYAHSDQKSGEREYAAIPAKFIRTRYKNDVQPHVLSFCMSLSRHKFNSTNLTRLDSSIDNVNFLYYYNSLEFLQYQYESEVQCHVCLYQLQFQL